MPPALLAPLVEALRRYRLLEPAQLEEVTRGLPANPLDPKALAGELIRRGWLTPYQANKLLQDKGHELLLGSYVLLEKLGEGGMGAVFKAKNWKLGRVVALKLIRKERLDNEDAIRRFGREVRAAAALDHVNIVRAYDADEVSGAHLLVMEYVEGTDLSKLVKQRGALPVAAACEYVRQAALGLQHAFERGLVHRDIKPANLLLTSGGVVKVLDMGLARLHHSAADDDKSSAMTHEGAVMGTPDYMAPEQTLDSHTVDIRADLYSLGCTLYFLLTGKVPFPGGSLGEKLMKHQLREPVPVEQHRPDVPPQVAAVVRRLMAKRPEDRYRTPAEAAATLADILGGPGVPAGTSVLASPVEADDTAVVWSSVVRPPEAEIARLEGRRRLAGRRGLWAGGVGVVVLLGLGALLPVLLRSRRVPAPGPQPAVAEGDQSRGEEAAAFDRWVAKVAALPAERQVKEVSAKLKERNPGFDGTVKPGIEGGVVTQLIFLTDNVRDISPVRALTGLRSLVCPGSDDGKGSQLVDLSPLKGMALTSLQYRYAKVSDLSPLKDMKLTNFMCQDSPVFDLSPLKDMKLMYLNCVSTQVSDLSPLKGMPLTSLVCNFNPERDGEILRSLKTLEQINGKSAAEFWKDVDAKKP